MAGMGHNFRWVFSEPSQFISASSLVHVHRKSIKCFLLRIAAFLHSNLIPIQAPFTHVLVSVHVSPTQCQPFPQLCDSHYICNARRIEAYESHSYF